MSCRASAAAANATSALPCRIQTTAVIVPASTTTQTRNRSRFHPPGSAHRLMVVPLSRSISNPRTPTPPVLPGGVSSLNQMVSCSSDTLGDSRHFRRVTDPAKSRPGGRHGHQALRSGKQSPFSRAVRRAAQESWAGTGTRTSNASSPLSTHGPDDAGKRQVVIAYAPAYAVEVGREDQTCSPRLLWRVTAPVHTTRARSS